MSPDQVVVCAPEEGIYLTMMALIRPGDHVVAMMPGYQSLYEVSNRTQLQQRGRASAVERKAADAASSFCSAHEQIRQHGETDRGLA